MHNGSSDYDITRTIPYDTNNTAEALATNFILSFQYQDLETTTNCWKFLSENYKNSSHEVFILICASRLADEAIAATIEYIFSKIQDGQIRAMISANNFSSLISCWLRGSFNLFKLMWDKLPASRRAALLENLINTEWQFNSASNDYLQIIQLILSNSQANQLTAFISDTFRHASSSGQIQLIKYIYDQATAEQKTELKKIIDTTTICGLELILEHAAAGPDDPTNLAYLLEHYDISHVQSAIDTKFVAFCNQGHKATVQSILEQLSDQHVADFLTKHISKQEYIHIAKLPNKNFKRITKHLWDRMGDVQHLNLFNYMFWYEMEPAHIETDNDQEILLNTLTNIATSRQKRTLLFCGQYNLPILTALIPTMKSIDKVKLLIQLVKKSEAKPSTYNNYSTPVSPVDSAYATGEEVWKMLTLDEKQKVYNRVHLVGMNDAIKIVNIYNRHQPAISCLMPEERFALADRCFQERKYRGIKTLLFTGRLVRHYFDQSINIPKIYQLFATNKAEPLKYLLDNIYSRTFDDLAARAFQVNRKEFINCLLTEDRVANLVDFDGYHALFSAIENANLVGAEFILKTAEKYKPKYKLNAFREACRTNRNKIAEYFLSSMNDADLNTVHTILPELLSITSTTLRCILMHNDYKLLRSVLSNSYTALDSKNRETLLTNIPEMAISKDEIQNIQLEEARARLADMTQETQQKSFKQARFQTLFSDHILNTKARLTFFTECQTSVEFHQLNKHQNPTWDWFLGKVNTDSWKNTFKKIRDDSFSVLEAELSRMTNDQEKLTLLHACRESDLFKRHRNNFFFQGAFGRTSTVKKIEAKIAAILRQDLKG